MFKNRVNQAHYEFKIRNFVVKFINYICLVLSKSPKYDSS